MEHDADVPTVSIIVLTYNRPDEIYNNVIQLLALVDDTIEIIIVDNASEVPVSTVLPDDDRIKLVELGDNIGVGGRNAGVMAASGDIVITIDDDVTGLTNGAIQEVIDQFKVEDVAVINFKVIDEKTHEITNWCHHRKKEIYADTVFDTYEISEGAVAFRKEIMVEAGLYPESFFISHEGADLAIRIMDLGCRVIYVPSIVVKHSHCTVARVSWRRYYFDTRNVIWLVIRSFPVFEGLKILIVGVGSLFVYSVRDGYFKYWLKGILDGLLGFGRRWRERKVISDITRLKYQKLKSHNPSIFYLLRQRLFKRKVSI